MQRHGTEGRREQDELDKPEVKPSFLTARELQAKAPTKAQPANADLGDDEPEERAPKSTKKGSRR